MHSQFFQQECFMKKSLGRTFALSVLMGSLVLFGAGCGKKTVIPPDGDKGSLESELSGGKDINYPLAEGGYSENSLPVEGTLDDSTAAGRAGSDSAADQQSDAYKRLHGRSSINLSPIYFDFDQAGVRPGMTEVLVQNAEYLKTIPGVMVTIEGNSDERGTNEYNLALGERRAINSRQYLINLGVAPDRMRTLSYGEERPLFLGQDEDAYSMNRRVDFVID
jgi:peptidoglycan-associated lipoprotein